MNDKYLDPKYSDWNSDMKPNATKGGIYKIYFEGFEDNCYVGETAAVGGFKARASQHRGAIWKQFQGIAFNDTFKRHYKSMTYRDFMKLDDKEKLTKLMDFETSRKRKLESFYNDRVVPGEPKYIKMMYFMDSHNLSLSDLRFKEVKKANKSLDEQEAFYIDTLNTYINGFNSPSLVEEVFGKEDRFANDKDRMLLQELLKIYNGEKEYPDTFVRWNASWNFYQTFKFDFLSNYNAWFEKEYPLDQEKLSNILDYLADYFFKRYKTNFDKWWKTLDDERNELKSFVNGHKEKSEVSQYITEKCTAVLSLYNYIRYETDKDLASFYDWTEDEIIEIFLDGFKKRVPNLNPSLRDETVLNFFHGYDKALDLFKKDPCGNLKGIDLLEMRHNSLLGKRKSLIKDIDIYDESKAVSSVEKTLKKLKEFDYDPRFMASTFVEANSRHFPGFEVAYLFFSILFEDTFLSRIIYDTCK